MAAGSARTRRAWSGSTSSNAEELHDRLEQLNGRKRELEGALQALQQSVTSSVRQPQKPQPQMVYPPPAVIPAHLQDIIKVPQELNPHPRSTEMDDSLAAFGKFIRRLTSNLTAIPHARYIDPWKSR